MHTGKAQEESGDRAINKGVLQQGKSSALQFAFIRALVRRIITADEGHT